MTSLQRLFDKLLSYASSGIGNILALLAVIVAARYPSMQVLAPCAALVLLIISVAVEPSKIIPLHGAIKAFAPYLTFLLILGGAWFVTRYIDDQRVLSTNFEALNVKVGREFPITITNDRGVGGLFNYWSASGGTDGRMHCFQSGHKGNSWFIDPLNQFAAFSFDRHDRQQGGPKDSSGGYITFYDHPISRRDYKYLSFFVRLTASSGPSDLGVRLASDDASIPTADREIVAYQVPSLQAIGTSLGSSWQRVDIYLAQFEQTEDPQRPWPRGIDQNSVNKIVFYLTDKMVDSYKKANGTLWFRDISFAVKQNQ